MRTTTPAPDDPEATNTPARSGNHERDQVRRTGTLPPGHRLPMGYESRFGAIWQVVPRTDREGKPATPLETRVTYGPLWVARMLASHAGEQWFDLEWRDEDRVVARRVDGAVLRSGRALVRELGTAGIPVIDADAKHVERYLAAYLVANRKALHESRITIARHLGWQEDGRVFVTGDGTPWPVEPAHLEQRPALAAHRPSGTLEGWRQAIARIERYPVVRAALAAGFAPPLLRVLGANSFTVDISGRSTRGKSTAAAVALSPWARPETGAGMMTWRSGIIGLEQRLNLVRGLPVVFDETRVVKNPEIVDQILYHVPMNHGQARGGAWAYASMLPWQTVLISTGEQPALSFTSHEGAAARTLSLRRAPFGLDGLRSAADARAVTDAIGEHYGVAGPLFAEKLLALLEEADGAERLRKRHGELAEAHTQAARNDIARRRAPAVAMLHLAAQLAYEWGIVPLTALEVEVFTDLFGDEAEREDRGEMALEVVRGLIAAQGHRICPRNHQDTGVAEAPAAGWIGGYVDVEGMEAIAILPSALAAAFNRANPPIALDAVRNAWTERGSIVMDRKEPKKLLKKRIAGQPQTRCYVFPMHVLDGTEAPDGAESAEHSPADPGPDSPPEETGEAAHAASWDQGELGAGGWPPGSYGDLANR